MQKLILIDGNAIIHRAFYAIPQTFRTGEGELVNAVYGFASMLLTILNNEKPDYIAVSFDLKGKTFRHEEYKDYKATRVKAADELYDQIPRIKELVRTFEIPIYEIEGFEADDVLGTLAGQAEKTEDLQTFIVTGDMDAAQLVSDKTFILAPVKGFSQTRIFNTQKVREKYGLNPNQIPDMKGLQGDNSDNIKGVRGIGPKTALTLLQKYGSIEKIYENLHEITGNARKNLKKDRENAFFSKKLATIITDVPMRLNLEACKTNEYDLANIQKFFEKLNFKSLLYKLTEFSRHSSEKKAEEQSTQQSLF